MSSGLGVIEQSFAERTSTPTLLSAAAYRLPRLALAIALALVPAVVVMGGALLSHSFREAVTDHRNVQETFARFVSATATASAISVSVAVLTMRRELRGVASHRRRHKDNMELRHEVASAAGAESAPLVVADFLALALENVRAAGAKVAQSAGRAADEIVVEDATLAQYLRVLDRRCVSVGRELKRKRSNPDLLLGAALDFEYEVTLQLARRFARAPGVSEETRADLATLHLRLDDYLAAAKYVKTLDLEWGLSRMSIALLTTSLPAVIVAGLMTLSYGEGAVATLGKTGAAALVALALAVVVLPLAEFASYLLRFVFVNENTLPTDAFVLGPEEAQLVRDLDADDPTPTG
jgi:hypothetical protein